MIKYSFSYILKKKKLYIIYIILSLVISLISLTLPYIYGIIVNYITTPNSGIVQKLIHLCMILTILSLLKILLSYLNNRINIIVQTYAGYKMNFDIIKHLQNVNYSDFPSNDTTYLTQKVNNDANAITSFSMTLIRDVFINSIAFIVASIILFRINTVLFVLLFILNIIYILMYITFRKKIYRLTLISKESQSIFFNDLNDQFEYYKPINLHSLNDWFLSKLTNSFRKLMKELMKSQLFINFYNSLDSTIFIIAQVIIYLWGGINVFKGLMSIGEFLMAINYFQILMSSAQYFSNLGKEYQNNYVSYKRIEELLKIQEAANGLIEFDSINEIFIENMFFSYKEKDVIQHFSYKFEKGNIYCIVGANGVGKSTLINVMLGLYSRNQGNIYYNKEPIEKINMRKLRHDNIAVLEQNPFFINDSIAANIILDRSLKNDELKNFINRFSFNIDSLKNIIHQKKQSGTNLSGGEKQQIGFIRMALKNASVIIADEPTNNLDNNNCNKIIDYFVSNKKDKIMIIITHDKRISDICDFLINL